MRISLKYVHNFVSFVMISAFSLQIAYAKNICQNEGINAEIKIKKALDKSISILNVNGKKTYNRIIKTRCIAASAQKQSSRIKVANRNF